MSSSTLRLWLRPHLIGLHVFAIAAIVFSVFMGLWQLGVYDSRQADERADRQDVPTVPLSQVWGPGQRFTSTVNHRPVTVIGRFADSVEQVWISGKSEDGTAGYWLVAPILVSGDDEQGAKSTALMVVRGWSAEAGEFASVPAGEQRIRVILEPGEMGSGALDGDRVAQALRIPAFINEFDYELYSGFGVNTTPAAAGGLVLVSPPGPESSWATGLRNLMYGIQWFVFGAFALFMWWRMSTESVASGRQRVA